MKTILITGSTDGLGLEAAKVLRAQGHRVIVHGRNASKLGAAKTAVGTDLGLVADLSDLGATASMAADVIGVYGPIDVLVNNAGVFKTPSPRVMGGTMDVRFVVNTLAPWILTRDLMETMSDGGRVINLSSAAQRPVDLTALAGKRVLEDDFDAYAQSKLAIVQWSNGLVAELGAKAALNAGRPGPMICSLNPGSLLATNMVRDGFGMAGKDIMIGANIIAEAAAGARFENAGGLYFDNDAGDFGTPHPEAQSPVTCQGVLDAVRSLTREF